MKKIYALLAACFLLCSCVDGTLGIGEATHPDAPLPAPTIQQYVGISEVNLMKKLGQPDGVSAHGVGIKELLYHWHTRDAVLAPKEESAWRGNAAFVQRQLPTNNIPLREACDLIFTTQNGVVTRADAKGGCW
jgi:hypothetical protein